MTPPYTPKVRDWLCTPANIHFSTDSINNPNEAGRDYFLNVIEQMKRLDLAIGQYYRLTINIMTWAPVPPASSEDGHPLGKVVQSPYCEITDELSARHAAVCDGMEGIRSCLSDHAVSYMAAPAEAKLNYQPQLHPFTSARLRRCPGPFELELLNRLVYLGEWGINEDHPDLETRVILSPDSCDQGTHGRNLSFVFSIEEFRQVEHVPHPHKKWQSILHGGLIYSGPHPDSPTLDREMDDHQHKWPKVWSVHT